MNNNIGLPLETSEIELPGDAGRAARAEAMRMLASLSGGIAHDLNNLLTVILGNAEDLIESEVEAAAQSHLILSAAERAQVLVHQLMAFAQHQSLALQPLSLADVIDKGRPRITRGFGRGHALRLKLAADLWSFRGDANGVTEALTSLCQNAAEAMPEGGAVEIAAYCAAIDEETALTLGGLAPGGYVVIDVLDSGLGITDEVLAHACEPFFTTKPIGTSSGLGLSTALGYVRQSGGNLMLERRTNANGTRARMYLPAAEQAASAASNKPFVSKRDGDPTVLFVEDDEMVRSHGLLMLYRLGYRVLAAANADEALALLDGGAEFDMMFTDIVMPGPLDGVGLAEEVGRRRPGTPVLMCSGFSRAMMDSSDLPPGRRFIRKPYRRSEVASHLQEMLAASVAGKLGN